MDPTTQDEVAIAPGAETTARVDSGPSSVSLTQAVAAAPDDGLPVNDPSRPDYGATSMSPPPLDSTPPPQRLSLSAPSTPATTKIGLASTPLTAAQRREKDSDATFQFCLQSLLLHVMGDRLVLQGRDESLTLMDEVRLVQFSCRGCECMVRADTIACARVGRVFVHIAQDDIRPSQGRKCRTAKPATTKPAVTRTATRATTTARQSATSKRARR